MHSHDGTPVLIAGAGIAGLTAALALARSGIACQVLEMRTAPSEEGAGIQLGPNATRLLMDLGLQNALRARASAPECVSIHRSRDARVLARVPLGAHAEQRFGAPYWTFARADLHQVLRRAAAERPEIRITFGFAVEAFTESARAVTVTGANAVTASGSLLLAADGIHSAVRGQLGIAPPEPVEHSAWRASIDAADYPDALAANVVGLWLGRRAHLVHYPVAGGTRYNLVAVVPGGASAHGWGSEADPSALVPQFDGWHPTARTLLAQARGWRKWSLRHARPVSVMARGRVALLGDAAHPVLPFLAQGGALAIEDAVTVAHAIVRSGPTPDALHDFAAERLQRCARVQAASAQNGQIYHLWGLAAFVRDAVLRLTPESRLLARFDWLYGHDTAGRDVSCRSDSATPQ